MNTLGLTEPLSAGPPVILPEALRRHWMVLSAPTSGAARFAPEHLDGLPTPVRRWLTRAIAPGTPLLRAAVLRQHGEIKVGRWHRYEADWLLAPPEGFIWAATTHLGPMFIRAFDRYTAGAGQMRWRLLGRVPLMSATGADVTRSSMGRLAGELCFVPAVALSDAVTWEPVDDRRAVARVDADGWTHRVTMTVAESGRLERIDVPRWGNPDGKAYREHLFTTLIAEPEGCFDGFTVPLSARAGWCIARITAPTRSSSGSPSTGRAIDDQTSRNRAEEGAVAMTEKELLERAGDLTARQVFGDPITADGVTVIPVARVGAGLGGASGEGQQQEGSGSGFGYGFGARPAGAYVIRDGKVSWAPAVDVNRIVLGAQVVAAVVVLSVRAVLAAREAAGAGSRRPWARRPRSPRR